jgi:hypothetical protein
MNSSRRAARLAGAFFLISYFGVFTGMALSGPYLDAPDYLATIYPNRSQVILGEFLWLLNDAAIVGIAVVLFPILKRHSETLALGYVCNRVIEAATLIVGKISALSLITVSQDFIAAGAPDTPYFQAVGASAMGARYWASQVNVVFFISGGLILYSLLYQSKLLPRFIPIWGFIAVAALIAANVFPVPDLTEGFHPAQLLFFPIMLNELFLGIWLIVKGFKPSAIASESAKTDINEV